MRARVHGVRARAFAEGVRRVRAGAPTRAHRARARAFAEAVRRVSAHAR